MKFKATLALLFLFLTGISTAQVNGIDTSLTLDMMVAPNSPGFTLLGLNPTVIDKPSSPTDFAFSIVNATNSFSGLPKNYAVEFLPVPLIFSKCKATKDIFSSKFGHTLAQTFSISAAFTTSDTVNTSVRNYIATRSGIGFKVSILRGKLDDDFEEYKTGMKNARKQLANLHALNEAALKKARESDEIYLLLTEKQNLLLAEMKRTRNDSSLSQARKDLFIESLTALYKMVDSSKQRRSEEINKAIATEENIVAAAKKLNDKIENIKYRRWGAMLDVAGGTVLGFRNNDFQNSIVQQYAFWVNGGWSGKKGLDILALARYNTNVKATMNADSTFSDQNSFDVGAKIEFSTSQKRFSIGAEGIARFVSDTSVFRYTLNTSYQVKKNQALTLSVGKDFGSTKASVGGNLIATLNYILAFGTQRLISLADLEKEERAQ